MCSRKREREFVFHGASAAKVTSVRMKKKHLKIIWSHFISGQKMRMKHITYPEQIYLEVHTEVAVLAQLIHRHSQHQATCNDNHYILMKFRRTVQETISESHNQQKRLLVCLTNDIIILRKKDVFSDQLQYNQ